jgi:predicted nucleotidyltransferase component of viral defense system
MPKIRLDLSADEIVVDAPVLMPVRHGFSDCPEGGISIQCYSYAEVFAEKIRALKERTRPRDLYDVINFYRRPESLEAAADVRTILRRKCEFKSIAFPSLADLDTHRDVCATGWDQQLSHQVQVLPPFEAFWGELPSFFSWLEPPETVVVPVLQAIP